MTLPADDPPSKRRLFPWGCEDLDDNPQMSGKDATQGPYTLSGPVPRPDAARMPIRGDLAHIAFAGRYFVPHYVVPQPRAVMPGGAPVLAAPAEGADEVCTLMEGDSFEVLDLSGAWAWGCLGPEGPVGYVHIDRLEPVN